jgi:hypothetical protein
VRASSPRLNLEAYLMGCLLVMLGAFFPRLAVLFIWLARPAYFDAAINSFVIALLGILFLPFTTLTYVLLWKPTGLDGLDLVWLGLAFLLDVFGAATSAYGNRDRVPGYNS